MENSYSIVGIIQSVDRQLFCYDTTYQSYQEALTKYEDSLNMIVVLKVVYENVTSYKFVDMRSLLNKYLVSSEYVQYYAVTWKELEEFLKDLYLYTTDTIKRGEVLNKYCTHSPVPRYQYYRYNGEVRCRTTPFFTNLEDRLNIVSLGYTSKLDVNYVNKDFPEIRGLSHRRIDLPDLVFTKKDSDYPLDLRNTIASVDGTICYPIYSESTKELYACNGARMLKNTTDSNSLNILLMDFGKLGTLHHYKLSECKQELIIKHGTDIWMYKEDKPAITILQDPVIEFWQTCSFSMKFKLPLGCPAGVPILSLAGRMFLQGLDDLHTYVEDGYTVVEFHIAASVLENIVASNLQHQNLYYDKSDMFRVILSYVFSNIFIDQGYEYDAGSDEWKAIQFHMDQIIPFVTIVEQEEDKQYGIDVITPMTVMRYSKLVFPSKANGLLMNRKTRELIDYTKLDYHDQTLVTFSRQNPLFIQKRECGGTNNLPHLSDAVTYNEAISAAPKDTEIYYNVRDSRFRLFSKEQNQIIAESVTAPYVSPENPSTWNNIIAGLTEEEQVPRFDAASGTWYLIKDDLAYAVSEPIRVTLSDYDWDMSGNTLTYAQVTSEVSETLLTLVYNEEYKRFEYVDRNGDAAAYSAKCLESDSGVDWYVAGDTTVYTQQAAYSLCKTSQFTSLMRNYDDTTDTWYLIDNQNGTIYATGTRSTGITYTDLAWYKIKPYTQISWYKVSDGRNIIPDGVKYDRMAWESNPTVFKSNYEQYEPGVFIKDHRDYVLVDFNIYKPNDASNDLLDDDVNPDKMADEPTKDPVYPVLTSEHERVIDTIKIGVGTAPKALANLKVSPYVSKGNVTTTTLITRNAANIDADYGIYDGTYLQTVEGAISVERIWAHSDDNTITMCYVTDENDSTKNHWAIKKDDAEIFISDMADEGSAPYNSNLIWRLV